MGEHRSRIGAALLASVAVFVAAAASTAATNAAGWCNPIVIGLLAAAFACLVGSVIAFRPVRSGNAAMNHLIRRQWRSLKRRRKRQKLLHRRGSKEEHLMLTTEPPPTEPLEGLYYEGEQLRASILLSTSAIPGDLMRGAANQRQIQRERLAREWDRRVLADLPEDVRPKWLAAAILPERSLEPASTIAGVREFLATKLACLKEIVSQLQANE
jgi:hypothetical protein